MHRLVTMSMYLWIKNIIVCFIVYDHKELHKGRLSIFLNELANPEICCNSENMWGGGVIANMHTNESNTLPHLHVASESGRTK